MAHTTPRFLPAREKLVYFAAHFIAVPRTAGKKKSRRYVRGVENSWQYALSTLCGLGNIPAFPGTLGTLAALVFALPALYLGAGSVHYAFMAFVATLVGIHATSWLEKKTGQHDVSATIIDEVAGTWVTLAGVAFLTETGLMTALPWPVVWVAVFFIFRLSDIAKPWPANIVDRYTGGGFGTVVDDVIAGGWAAGFIWLAEQGGLLSGAATMAERFFAVF